MMMKVQLCLLSKRRNTNSFPDTDKIDFEYCNLYIVYCIKEEWKWKRKLKWKMKA